jgi:hypothetical protein
MAIDQRVRNSIYRTGRTARGLTSCARAVATRAAMVRLFLS